MPVFTGFGFGGRIGTSGGAGGNPLEYSTEEQVIGAWIDGKPLYQKTVDCGTWPNNASKNIPHGIENVDIIWIYDGYSINPTNFESEIIPINHPTGTLNTICRVGNSSISLLTETNAYKNYSVSITIRYTKTTDAPGSYVAPVKGDKYSYEERIVGEWVDGKKLYQKTIDFGALPNNTQKIVNHGIADVDLLWVTDIIGVEENRNITSMSNQWIVYANYESVIVRTSSNESSKDGIVTVQYTKTTD